MNIMNISPVVSLKARNETINEVIRSVADILSSTSLVTFDRIFAIPKDKLEAFKFGIKDLAGARFYAEQTNSQNLLPQKQIIEENQKQTEKYIADLKAERAGIVKNHSQKQKI